MIGLISKIVPSSSIKKIKTKVDLLGVNNEIKVLDFITIRLVFTIFIFVLLLVLSKYGYFVAPIVSIIFYFGLEYFFIDLKIEKRKKQLEREALFFFEVFVLSLESGRNIRQALNVTANNVDSQIALEFKKTLEEMDMGKSINESLEAMKKRIPSETINNAILNMIQSSTFGNSIVDAMYQQIDYLREKHILDIKGEIAKLPTKISVISVVFFVPIMMLIILIPVILNYIMK